MRYVIFGAGAGGGTIGGRLHRRGHDVVLIARGTHLDALRQAGLRLRWPDSDVTPHVPAVDSPASTAIGPDDAVLLAVKSHHTAAAIGGVASVRSPDTAVICAQNGVENERVALRRSHRLYAGWWRPWPEVAGSACEQM